MGRDDRGRSQGSVLSRSGAQRQRRCRIDGARCAQFAPEFRGDISSTPKRSDAAKTAGIGDHCGDRRIGGRELEATAFMLMP
jgi:hypothetical protein